MNSSRLPIAQNQGSLTTQQRITDAAMTLFSTKGFAATGIRELADAANISTGSLYHYMGTKEDLLERIMTEGLTRFTSAGRLAISDVSGPARQIVALTRVHVATEVMQRRMAVVIDNEVRALTNNKRVVELRDAYEDLWRKPIAAGVESGIFHVAQPGLARLALIEMCNGVALWFRADGGLSVGEVCDRFSDLALAMIQARVKDSTEILSTESLEMRSAEHEVALVYDAFESFCPPEASAGLLQGVKVAGPGI